MKSSPLSHFLPIEELKKRKKRQEIAPMKLWPARNLEEIDLPEWAYEWVWAIYLAFGLEKWFRFLLRWKAISIDLDTLITLSLAV